MPKIRLIQTNFTSGEWSPRLAGHVDLQKRANACEELQNVIVWPHGGATRRMGTIFRGHAKEASSNPRLKDFSFNDIQTYVLEFGDGYVRFWRDGGQVMKDGAPLELVLPYTAAEVYELGFAQSADVLFMCHGNHKPQKIIRSGADAFELVECIFTNQPTQWEAGNWPSRINLHQQRTWWSGCPNHPQKLWFSATGNFLEMGGAAKEDDSGAGFSLDSDQVNQIRGMVAARSMVVLTSGGEWTLKGSGNAAISPTDVQATRYSNVGCAANVPPMLIGSAVLFMSRDRKKMREFIYNLEQDGFVPIEASLLSEHLLRPQVKQMAWQQDPDSIVWSVLDDGTLAAMTYLRDQQVYAWHRHETQGKVVSICANGAEDYTELWLAVERNGKVCIEQMASPWQGNSLDDVNCFFVDCGLMYEGEPLQELSGLEHLEGMEVQVLADGGVQKARTVTSGTITLDAAARKIVVGLGYSYRVTPLQPEGGHPEGTGQGAIKRLSKVIIRVYKSVGMSYKVGDDKERDTFLRSVNKSMNKPVEPLTDDLEIPSIGTGWQSNPRITVFGDDPLPFSLLALIREVEVTA